jgi:hypothetical protein
MIEARQEVLLVPILDWLCPYYRRDRDVEGDERALPGPGTCPWKVRESVLLRHTHD